MRFPYGHHSVFRLDVFFIVLVWMSAVSAGSAWAAPASEEAMEALRQHVGQLTQLVQQLNSTVQAQQARIAQLEQGRSVVVETAQPIGVSARASTAAGLSAFNPEIGVIGDIVGQLSESSEDGEGNDKLSAREVELVFGHPVDPYSRFDATIAFSDFEEASLEEAYLTHWGLPGGIKARLGRLRPKIGKASPLHRDSLDTVDEPLVVSSYLGAEGLSRTAAEFSGFVSVPWTVVTHELIGGVMEGGVGEGASLFGETRRRPSLYAHLKNFWDVSDVTSVELGGTYLIGSRDTDKRFEVNALGFDATLVHHVTPANKLKWQNELYWQHRDESVTIDTDPDTGEISTASVDNTPWGAYSLLDYRLSPRVGIGGRFDYVEPIDLDPLTRARHADTAWSGYLTFYQSEFARWRLQYRHSEFAAGGNDNTVFLQGTVAIGVHQHQIQ